MKIEDVIKKVEELVLKHPKLKIKHITDSKTFSAWEIDTGEGILKTGDGGIKLLIKAFEKYENRNI